MTTIDLSEIGQRYDCALRSPTYADLGIFLRPGTYQKHLQTTLRDEVLGAVTLSIVDRDIQFWKRISQVDWSQGGGQSYFTNPSRFDDSKLIDVHLPGQISLVQKPLKVLSDSAATASESRGGVIAHVGSGAVLFFPGPSGDYVWTNNPSSAAPTWNYVPVAAGARISDMATDGSNVWLSFHNLDGVYVTTAAAPNAVVAYDTPGAGDRYARLAYDPLRKKLYAIRTPASGSSLVSINAAASETVVFDFVQGQLDALELYQGDIVMTWNSGRAAYFSQHQSRLYRYDGSVVNGLCEMPDGVQAIGLKSYLGVLFIGVQESDPFSAVAGSVTTPAVYYVVGSTGPQRLAPLIHADRPDSYSFVDTTSFVEAGTPSVFLGVGQHLFIAAGDHTWRYDMVLGGLSYLHGDLGGVVAITGMLFCAGKFFAHAVNGAAVTDNGIFELSLPGGNFTEQTDAEVESSRIDADLPYVNKYWHAFECYFNPLPQDTRIRMFSSVDDGASYSECAGSPVTTLAATSATFLVQTTNPHIRYKARLVRDNTGAETPVITSVSAKYTVVNPDASVYFLTAQCYDEIRGRGSKVETPGYGLEALEYLDDIARIPELVTFYEPNDPDRTAHTCWVMSCVRKVANTGGVYSPLLSEGDVEVVLWEI